MALVREVASRAELEHYLGPAWRIDGIAPYGFDDRIGWDTHIVTALHAGEEGTFVVGFTDGPLED